MSDGSTHAEEARHACLHSFNILLFLCYNRTFPSLKLFIGVSQGLFSPISIRAFLSVISGKAYIEHFIKAIGCPYSIWNLDFFRAVIPPIFATEISQIQVLALHGLCDYLLSIGTGYSDLLSH